MKEWFSAVGKWFLTQSLAVKCSIIGLGAAVVVGAGAAGYLCLRPEEPREVVNEEVNVSDEAPTEEGQEPATQEPEETGENPTEPVEQNEEEQTEPVEDEEIEEEAYVKTSDKLVNGNFADGINGFEVYSFIPEDISYDVDAKNGFSIDIFDTGEEDWHIQLKQGGIKLQQGKWYQLTLDAKSSLVRSIICSMQRDGTDDDNWISYSGNKNLTLTKQWKTYTIIFQMTEKTDKNAIFNLAMGTVNGNRIRTDHTIGIRNIKLEQLADNWLDQLSQGDNLLKNANFAYEDILWEASVVAPGAAKTSFADGKAVFDISNAGTIDWHVQLKQSGITLEQGNGYRLTFKASSSVARAINIGFMDKDYVNWYGGGLVTLGAEQTVTVEFYMDKPTNTDVCMFLSMGKIENVDTPASVITLSDFSLVKVPDMAPTSSNGGGGGGGVNPITNLTDGWFVYDHNDRQVGSCYVDGDNGYRMDIANTGTEEWHIQLQKKNILLEKDKWYRITLDAKSTLDREIGIALQRDGAADEIWTVYSGGDVVSLTGEWQTFTKEFKMTSETDPATIYCLSLGSVGGKQISQAHTVWIKNLKLEEIEEPKKDSIALNTEMLDKNAWGSNVEASKGAVATVQYADGKAVFDITNVGEASHHVQFSQSGLMLEKGCKYEFTFRAISTEVRTISVGFLGGDRGWDWYGGEDIKISPISPRSRSAEDGLWRVEFTMKKETDTNATLAISLGMIEDGDIPAGQHTVTLSEFSLKKIAEPGPEGGVIYVKATDPQKTDEYGSKWIVEIDHTKYCPDVVQGESKVRITANLYSEKGFEGLLGACGADWSWSDTGVKTEAGGETTWTLEVDSFMGAAQIQINSMEGDCVEIRSIKVEVVTGTEEPDPGPEDEVIRVNSTDEKNTENGSEKWVVKIDHAKYCSQLEADIKEAKDKVKITVGMYSEKPFTVMLGACGKDDWSAWYDTGVQNAPAGESTWTLTADQFKGGAQVQIYSMEGVYVEIRSIKVEVVTGTEEPDPGPEDEVIRVNSTDEKNTENGSEKWVVKIDHAKYCSQLEADIKEAKDKVKITVGMYSEKPFTVMLGACGKDDWSAWYDTGAQNAPAGESTWTLTADKFKGGAQVQIYSMEGECVEIRSIKVEVVTGTEEPDPGPGTPDPVEPTDPGMLTGIWSSYIDNAATAEIKEKDGKQIVTIGNVGSEDYHVQLKQDGLKLEKGCSYKLTFNGSSTQNRTIKAAFLNAKYDWYGGADIELTGTDKLYTVEFTVGEDKATDDNMTLVFSMGKLSDAPAGEHTVTLSNFSLVKTKDAPKPEEPDPGPEGGVIRVNSTDKKTFDENGEKWIKEFDHLKYCPAIVRGESKVRITANLYSEKGFEGMLGACGNGDWSWFDTGTQREAGGESTWVLEVEKFNGGTQIQINSMEGDYVEIRSFKMEVVTGTEEPDPGMLSGSWNLTKGVASLTESGGKKIISITGESSNPWDIQLAMYGLNLEKGCTYKLTYNANAGADRTVVVGFQQNGGSYAQYADGGSGNGLGSVNLTATDTKYEAEFTMSSDTDSAAMFYVNMGGGGEGEITFSNFSLVKTKDAPKPENPDADTEMLTGTWGSYVATDQEAEATISEQDGKQVALITKVGTANWNVQLNQGGLNLEANTSYVFSFNVASTVARVIEVAFQSNTDSWYGGGKVLLPATADGAELGTYTVNFTMSGTADTNAKIVISMGAVTGTGGEGDPPMPTEQHTVTLSNFSLKKVN